MIVIAAQLSNLMHCYMLQVVPDGINESAMLSLPLPPSLIDCC